MKKFIGTQLGFLFEGIISLLPLLIAVIVIGWFGIKAENLGKYIFGFVPEKYLFRGLGIILVFLVLYLVGLFSKKTKIKERIFSKIPVIGIFFKVSGTAISLKEFSRLEPCIFLFPPACPSSGWIMKDQKAVWGEWIHIYLPSIPAMITGQIFIVRKECVIKLGNPSDSILKALLYNIEVPEKLIFLPWDGESKIDLDERKLYFGRPHR